MLELLLQEKDQENSEVQTHQIQLVSDRSQTVKAKCKWSDWDLFTGSSNREDKVCHAYGTSSFRIDSYVVSESEGYSGLNYYLPEESGMNLGDLLYYMKQESINPVWKISTLISHMNGVDYIAP